MDHLIRYLLILPAFQQLDIFEVAQKRLQRWSWSLWQVDNYRKMKQDVNVWLIAVVHVLAKEHFPLKIEFTY